MGVTLWPLRLSIAKPGRSLTQSIQLKSGKAQIASRASIDAIITERVLRESNIIHALCQGVRAYLYIESVRMNKEAAKMGDLNRKVFPSHCNRIARKAIDGSLYIIRDHRVYRAIQLN